MRVFRRRLIMLVMGLAVTSNCVVAAAPVEWLQLENFVVIDGTGAPAQPVARLVARDGLIVSIGQESAQPGTFDQVTTLALDDAWVIPGLIDAHVHLSGYPGDRDRIGAQMQQALRGGVTTVRDMGGDARVLADVGRAMQRGELSGLSIAYAALMGGENVLRDPRLSLGSVGYDAGTAPWAQSVNAGTDMPLAIARAIGAGASAIKLYGNLDRRLVASASAQAHIQGIGVWAHATVFPARPSDLLDAGVDVLSHAPYLIWEAVDVVPDDYGARREGPYDDIPADHRKIRSLLHRMAKSQTLLDTTLLIYRDAITVAEGQQQGAWATKAFHWGVELAKLAQETGVPLAAGTDRFLKDDWSLPDLHDELLILVEDAGLTPMAALICATRNGARAAGLADKLGTVEIGKRADLVVLGSDPVANISATRDIRLVIKAGRIVYTADPTDMSR